MVAPRIAPRLGRPLLAVATVLLAVVPLGPGPVAGAAALPLAATDTGCPPGSPAVDPTGGVVDGALRSPSGRRSAQVVHQTVDHGDAGIEEISVVAVTTDDGPPVEVLAASVTSADGTAGRDHRLLGWCGDDVLLVDRRDTVDVGTPDAPFVMTDARTQVARVAPGPIVVADLAGIGPRWSPDGSAVATRTRSTEIDWLGLPQQLVVQRWADASVGDELARGWAQHTDVDLRDVGPMVWSPDSSAVAARSAHHCTASSTCLTVVVRAVDGAVGYLPDAPLGWVGDDDLQVRAPCGAMVVGLGGTPRYVDGDRSLLDWWDPACLERHPLPLEQRAPTTTTARVVPWIAVDGSSVVALVSVTAEGSVPGGTVDVAPSGGGPTVGSTLSGGVAEAVVPVTAGDDGLVVTYHGDGGRQPSAATVGPLLVTHQAWSGCTDAEPLPATDAALWSCVADAAFADVDPGHPFAPSIGALTDAAVVGAAADADFLPAAPLTRAEAAEWLYRLAGSPDGGAPSCSTAPLPDVPSEHPSCGAVAWMVAEGLTSPYPDGGFHPSSAVRRQAFVAWLWRRAGAPVASPSAAGFDDVPAGHPFRDAIAWAAGQGIVTGYDDGTFRPAAAVSRQAAAALLWRAGRG